MDTEPQDPIEVTPQMLDAMRQGEASGEWLAQHPEVLEPYRGQWVVVHQSGIVAHSPDGSEAARKGNSRAYPGAWLFYVPTREEAKAVRV